MGCSASHLENDGDYFLEKVYSTFPLNQLTFEEFEDCFEKNLADCSTAEQFSKLFRKQFSVKFENSEMKQYQYLMVDYTVSKLNVNATPTGTATATAINHDYFKYNFLLLLFPFLNHNISKDELVNNFKEIFIYLCDFKKSQIEIVKQMQSILFNYFYFVLHEIPEVIVQFITHVQNDDKKLLIFLNNKLNFFHRKRIDDEVNRVINSFFANMKKSNLSNSLTSCFSAMPLHYFEIQRFFS